VRLLGVTQGGEVLIAIISTINNYHDRGDRVNVATVATGGAVGETHAMVVQ
jgi:hypothetical protein